MCVEKLTSLFNNSHARHTAKNTIKLSPTIVYIPCLEP